MTADHPTDAELRQAYLRAGLDRLGYSYQRALETPHLRLAMTDSAMASRRRAQERLLRATAPATPTPAQQPQQAARPPRQQCFLSLQFQVKQED